MIIANALDAAAVDVTDDDCREGELLGPTLAESVPSAGIVPVDERTWTELPAAIERDAEAVYKSVGKEGAR